jgi:hypothetical protein
MDYDDYDSYAPLASSPPTRHPSPPRPHSTRPLAIAIAALLFLGITVCVVRSASVPGSTLVQSAASNVETTTTAVTMPPTIVTTPPATAAPVTTPPTQPLVTVAPPTTRYVAPPTTVDPMAEIAYGLAYDNCFETISDASAAVKRSLSGSTVLRNQLLNAYVEGFLKGGGAAVKLYLPDAREGCVDGMADAL